MHVEVIRSIRKSSELMYLAYVVGLLEWMDDDEDRCGPYHGPSRAILAFMAGPKTGRSCGGLAEVEALVAA